MMPRTLSRRRSSLTQPIMRRPCVAVGAFIILFSCMYWMVVFYWLRLQDTIEQQLPHKSPLPNPNPNQPHPHPNINASAIPSASQFSDISWQQNLQRIEFRDVSQYDRIVVIGDLHGDLPQAINALVLTGIIERNSKRWISKNTILIQTGDIVDRGTQSIEIYKLFLDLRKQCALHGSLVLNQVGNHEHLQFINDFSYVNQQEINHYGGYQQWREMMSTKSMIGTFLRNLPVARIVGNSLFVHAGIIPEVSETFRHNLTALNQQFHDFVMELSAKSEVNPMTYYQTMSPLENALTGLDGPIWTRYYEPMYYDFNMQQLALEHMRNQSGNIQILAGMKGMMAMRGQMLVRYMCLILDQVLDSLKVKRMIIGHNVQQMGAVKVSCGGKLYSIDVGMSGHYGGNMAALEIDPKTDTVRIITDPNNPAHPLQMQIQIPK